MRGLDADAQAPSSADAQPAAIDASFVSEDAGFGASEPAIDAERSADTADAADIRDAAVTEAGVPCCRPGVVFWLSTHPDADTPYYVCGDAAPQWAPLQAGQSLCDGG